MFVILRKMKGLKIKLALSFVKRKAVSSTLAGLIVISIALASIFVIYALYLNGLLFVSRTNQ